MKRMISILLSLTLCLSVLSGALPARAVANMSWRIKDGEVTITAYVNPLFPEEVVLPQTIEGYPVTAIGMTAFSNCTNITSITIPDTVKTIGEKAFYSCYKLQKVTLPKGLTSMGAGVFSDCKVLTEVEIPDGVTEIADSAFFDCFALAKVSIPEGVTRIGIRAFNGCDALTEVDIPETVTHIDDSAFIGCSGLSQVLLPDGLLELGMGAFYGCDLKYNRHSKGLYLGSETNPYLVLMKAINTDITEMLIHEDTRIIDSNALHSCKALAEVVIPEKVIRIGGMAFYSCRGLSTVIIPASVTNIEDDAFLDCKNLNAVYFAGNAPTFGRNVFYGIADGMDTGATVWYHTGSTGWEDVTAKALSGPYTDLTLQEAEHLRPVYTYDNNHTCTEDGTERAACITCGQWEVRKAEGTASHQISYTPNPDATCTADGTKSGICEICGAAQTVVDEGSAFGHTYGDYSSNQDASCTVDGTKTAVCDTCGDRKTVADPGTATGHTYLDSVYHEDATCTADGTKTVVCTDCGDAQTVVAEGSALGHSFTCYLSDENYTCAADGTETAKCDRCDATDRRVAVGSSDHRYVDGYCVQCNRPEPDQDVSILTGSLTVYAEAPVVLKLTPVGETEPAVSLTVDSDSYSLSAAPGDYVLTVFQEGSVERCYAVTVKAGETELDLKLHLRGDITGDGRVNMGDVAKIYAHIKGSAPLTEDYQLLCADFTGDGRINVGDTAKVYSKIKAN